MRAPWSTPARSLDRSEGSVRDARTIRLYATEPGARTALKAFYGPGMSVFGYVGYGLFVGRV